MKKMTTETGNPIADNNNSITAGERGPLTFDNHELFNKLAHFNRERIPERVVHARGTGAYGHFKLFKSLSEYSCADFLQKEGSETELFMRFSTVGGGQDSSDYARDPRGTAIKLYTNEGNYDLVGNNTPVFFIRDPSLFPDFVHSQKKNPQSNIPDSARMYEFWANHPQSFHQMTILMSDRGIPYSYRHINAYSSHTLSLWNSKGERFWVKWHFKTKQGVKTLTNEEAAEMSPHGAQEDLFKSITSKNFPKWRVNLQIMPEADSHAYKINPFDLTKVWPHSDYPLIEIGELELNRNVENYFAETEQSAFSPSNLVPGTGVSPDKVLQARLIAYPDAHRYRLGANYNLLDVNRPKCFVSNNRRDGAMAGIDSNHNQHGANNFFPSDDNTSPAPFFKYKEPPLKLPDNTVVKAYDSENEDNFSQAGDLYRQMSQSQKLQLINNIAEGLKHANQSIQDRIIDQCYSADKEYGKSLASKLNQLK